MVICGVSSRLFVENEIIVRVNNKKEKEKEKMRSGYDDLKQYLPDRIGSERL